MKPRQSPRSVRFYRFLLRLYPLEFRREFGDEMTLCFRDSLRAAAGTTAIARLWIETLLDVMTSAFRENWNSLHRFMNPKNLQNSRATRFILAYPFGSALAMLALTCIVLLGFKFRSFDFSDAAYFMAMIQTTVLCLIILISGFIVDAENRCLRLLGREVWVAPLIACTIGIGLMAVGIYRLQYLDLIFIDLLPLILQIKICGTIWVQVVMLNEIRRGLREISKREIFKGSVSAGTSQSATPA